MTDNHQELFQAAVIHFQAREYDKVITLCTRITAQYPNHHEAHALLGSAYRNIKRYSEAIKELTRAIEIVEETNTDSDKESLALRYDERGKCYAKKGYRYQAISDHARAIKILEKINGDKKFLTTAYYGRGSAHAKTGEHDKAIKDFTQVIKTLEAITILEEIDDLQKNLIQVLAGTHGSRGVAYNNRGQGDKAIDDFTQAINILEEIHDDTGALLPLYGSRGVNYMAKGFYDEAISDFERTKQLKIDEGLELEIGKGTKKEIEYNLHLAQKGKEINDFGLKKGWMPNTILWLCYALRVISGITLSIALLSYVNTGTFEDSPIKLDYAFFLFIMFSFVEWKAYNKRREFDQLQAQKRKRGHIQACNNLIADNADNQNVPESMRLELLKYNLNALTEIDRDERTTSQPQGMSSALLSALLRALERMSV